MSDDVPLLVVDGEEVVPDDSAPDEEGLPRISGAESPPPQEGRAAVLRAQANVAPSPIP